MIRPVSARLLAVVGGVAMVLAAAVPVAASMVVPPASAQVNPTADSHHCRHHDPACQPTPGDASPPPPPPPPVSPPPADTPPPLTEPPGPPPATIDVARPNTLPPGLDGSTATPSPTNPSSADTPPAPTFTPVPQPTLSASTLPIVGGVAGLNTSAAASPTADRASPALLFTQPAHPDQLPGGMLVVVIMLGFAVVLASSLTAAVTLGRR